MNVRWIWACKKMPADEADVKLNTNRYFLIKEEGRDKVLAFRYVVEPENMPMPNGVFAVKDPFLLEELDNWLNKKTRREDETKDSA
jgi:hypothetical protein